MCVLPDHSWLESWEETYSVELGDVTVATTTVLVVDTVVVELGAVTVDVVGSMAMKAKQNEEPSFALKSEMMTLTRRHVNPRTPPWGSGAGTAWIITTRARNETAREIFIMINFRTSRER